MSGLTNGDIVAYDGGHHVALRIVPCNMHCHPVLDVTVAANLYAVDVSCGTSSVSGVEMHCKQGTDSLTQSFK